MGMTPLADKPLLKPEFELLEQFNNTLHQSIPITRAMGIKAVNYDGTQLRLSAPGASNLNDKQTIFAGSSYTIAVLCGWSLLFLKLAERGVNADIAVYKGEIIYSKPATGDFYALCNAPQQDDIGEFFTTLATRKKAKMTLTTKVYDEHDQVVDFTGHYAVREMSEQYQ